MWRLFLHEAVAQTRPSRRSPSPHGSPIGSACARPPGTRLASRFPIPPPSRTHLQDCAARLACRALPIDRADPYGPGGGGAARPSIVAEALVNSTIEVTAIHTSAARKAKNPAGVAVTTPITIAAQPSHLGSAAPRRIASPEPIVSATTPAATGKKSSPLSALIACAADGSRSSETSASVNESPAKIVIPSAVSTPPASAIDASRPVAPGARRSTPHRTLEKKIRNTAL